MVFRGLHTSSRLSLTHDELRAFNQTSIDHAIQSGIVQPGPYLSSIRCNECPEECILGVEVEYDGGTNITRAHAFCPYPGEGSRLIIVDANRLNTWRTDPCGIARCVCNWLNPGSVPSEVAPGCIWRLGVIRIPGDSYTTFLSLGLGSSSAARSILESLELRAFFFD